MGIYNKLDLNARCEDRDELGWFIPRVRFGGDETIAWFFFGL